MVHHERHDKAAGVKLNWLRAAVLGANDGIVSTASIVAGVAGATESAGFILTAGIAGISAGALSMAVGEYVSVSTQRDTEEALLEKERGELASDPDAEHEELAGIYMGKGLSPETARTVARELMAHDALAAHAEAELHIDPAQLTNPWHAAIASAASFTVGGIIPILAIIFAPPAIRIPVLLAAVVVALIVTGSWSAHEGGASKTVATLRVVIGGVLAMAITYGIGSAFGVVGL